MTAGIRWRAWRLRDDIYSSVRALTFDVLANGEPDETGEQKIAEWQHTNASRLDRARRTLNDIYADEAHDLATLVGGRPPDPQHDTEHWNGSDQHLSGAGFVTPVPVRWSDIDMYQHVNHATMVTILEEARIPFLADAFGADITTTGLLIAEVKVSYKGQLRLMDSPLQVTIRVNRLRAVDFTLGYEVRSVQRRCRLQAGRDRRNAVGGLRHR